jgi:acetoacetate decarboxylase
VHVVHDDAGPERRQLADFPVRKIIAAHHFLADLTLPYGRVLYDYNKDA